MDWSQISQNLASLPNNPLFNFGLGMLSTPYQRTPVSFGQVLGNGVAQMDYARQMQAKQQQADMQAKMLQLRYQDAQAADQAQQAQDEARQKYGATLSPDEQTLFNADPQAYIAAHYKNDSSKPIFDAKDGGFVDPKTHTFTPITVGTGVPVPASVPRVVQPAPQSPIARLPHPVQNYVSNIEGRVGSQPMFDSFGVPSDALIRALQAVESGGNPNAVSKTGAQGIAQFEPATWRQYGQGSPFDPIAATAAESKYLQTLYRQFGGNPQLALAAYNMGPGAVSRAVASNAVGSPASATPVAPSQPGTPMTLAAYRAAQAQNGGYRTLTPDQVKTAGLPAGTVAQQAPDGKINVISKGDDFNANAPQQFGDPSLKGEAYAASLPDTIRPTVEAVIQGREEPPKGSAARSSYWMGILQAANKIDPTFDVTNYAKRYKTAQDFASSGSAGQQIRALQTLIQHVGEWNEGMASLHNTQSPWLNKALNAVEYGVGLKQQLPAQDLNAHTAATEIESLWKKGGGSVEEIKSMTHDMGTDLSPDGRRDVAEKILKLASGRLQALHSQYINGMGNGAVGLQLVDPKSLAIISSIDPALAKTYTAARSAPPSGAIANPQAPVQQPDSYAHLWEQ